MLALEQENQKQYFRYEFEQILAKNLFDWLYRQQPTYVVDTALEEFDVSPASPDTYVHTPNKTPEESLERCPERSWGAPQIRASRAVFQASLRRLSKDSPGVLSGVRMCPD